MNPTFPTKDWESWHDTMPGSPATLHVTGKVICPTTGFSAILVPHYPPSLNQSIYLLSLVVIPPLPGEIVHQTETEVDVHFREDTPQSYTHVTILPESITVEVKQVS